MNDLGKKCVAEALGTFMLIFIGAGAIVTNELFKGAGLLPIAIAHGLALSIGVSATMNVSGGHLNPAVTIAMLATKRIDLPGAIAYILSQCAGAIIGGFLLLHIYNGIPGGPAAVAAAGLGTPAPGHTSAGDVTAMTALLVEVALTFLLVFAIFGTAVDRRAPALGGFGIGLTIAADILLGGPISGASMNPARTLGPAIAGGVWTAHWVYWVGPILGALIAAFLYDFVILKEQKN